MYVRGREQRADSKILGDMWDRGYVKMGAGCLCNGGHFWKRSMSLELVELSIQLLIISVVGCDREIASEMVGSNQMFERNVPTLICG